VWHQRRRHNLVRQLVATTAGDALDYGCGWGDITALVAPQFASILGVDVSEDRIAFATTQHPAIRFETCRTDGLDLPSDSFDTVLSVVVVPFVPDIGQYLDECARVLRPGGQLVVLLPNPHSWLEWIYLTAGREPRRSRNLPSLAAVMTHLGQRGFIVEAQGGFFDPPFDRVTNLVEVGLAVLNTIGHLFGPRSRASYVGYRCRLNPR
jgi:ubiquinone/menaquinone biosynthesis C-methylase UbiE